MTVFIKPPVWCIARGFHADTILSRGLLGLDTVKWCGGIPTFRKTMLPPFSAWKDSVMAYFKVLYQNMSGGIELKHSLGKYSRFPCWGSNPGNTKYESGM